MTSDHSVKTENIIDKVFTDVSGTFAIAMVAIGERLGLFKKLASNGPTTSTELAQLAKINERYAREWLNALAAAGYLEYNSETRKFTLPSPYVPVLVEENGPMFLGGLIAQIPSVWKVMDEVVEAFKQGGGVPYSSYDNFFWGGIEKESRVYFENYLLQQWIPAVAGLEKKLEEGIRVADIGCGYGRALIKLAKSFPRSRYVGYDIHEPSILRAVENAREEGVEEIIDFHVLDVEKGIPGKFDLITTFDLVHDLKNPVKALVEIRKSLSADGMYLLLDYRSSDRLEDNFGPFGTVMYGFSVLFCMTTSLESGGEGLGTLGMPPSKVSELCLEAGFSSVKQLVIDDDFHTLYGIKI